MKKFLIPLLLLMVGFMARSQTVTLANPNGLALDTVTQAAAEGPTMLNAKPGASVSFTVLLTKINGTVAGTVTLQGSNNTAKGWQNVIDANGQVTFTLTDATQTINLYQNRRFLHYRVLFNPTGTWSGSYSGTGYKL